MKYFIFSFLSLLYACQDSKNITLLEGVYTASYEHEFGRNTDTLMLTKANNGNNVYQINRHTGLVKKMGAKEFPKEILTNTWILEYNPDKKVLTEQKEGKILVWDDSKLTLQLGNRTYKKTSNLQQFE
jgi:hypothetical protein